MTISLFPKDVAFTIFGKNDQHHYQRYHILHAVLILTMLCVSLLLPSFKPKVFYSQTWRQIIMLILARKKIMFSHLKTLTSFSCHSYRNIFISNLVITKQTNNFPLYSQLYNLRSPVKASINTLLESPSLTGEKNKTKLQNTSMTMITCIHMLSSSSVGRDKFLHSQIVDFA